MDNKTRKAPTIIDDHPITPAEIDLMFDEIFGTHLCSDEDKARILKERKELEKDRKELAKYQSQVVAAELEIQAGYGKALLDYVKNLCGKRPRPCVVFKQSEADFVLSRITNPEIIKRIKVDVQYNRAGDIDCIVLTRGSMAGTHFEPGKSNHL